LQIILQTFCLLAFYQQKCSRFLQGKAPLLEERRFFPAGWWRAAQAQYVIIPGPRTPTLIQRH